MGKVFSMTGFGSSSYQSSKFTLTAELKSLNSKSLDLTLKLPLLLKPNEDTYRSMISSGLKRGKIELSLTYFSPEGKGKYQLNEALLKTLLNKQEKMEEEMAKNLSSVFGNLLMVPGVIEMRETEEADEQIEEKAEEVVQEAIRKVEKFREDEGKQLEKDLTARIIAIEGYLEEVARIDPQRKEDVRKRLLSALERVRSHVQFDPNRFEQEMIFYIERMDITEEFVRLRSHLNYFSETINKEEDCGRKLGFIVQELGREINTIGSKAGELQIQQIVVNMKDELEKIKEQVSNIL